MMRDYMMGDRMGSLEDALADGLRLDGTAETYPAAGPILWSNGRELVMDAGDAHTLIISSTGGGKTVSQIMPMLRATIKAGESLLVTDVKGGELYESAFPYLKQQGYNVWVVNMREPLHGARYNPLELPFQLLNREEPELRSAGHQMLVQVTDLLILGDLSNDPYWDRTARDTFLGLAYYLAYLDNGKTTLGNIYDLFCEMRDNEDLFLKKLKVRLAERYNHPPGKNALLDGAARLLRTRLFSSSSPRTSSSIDSVLAQKLNDFIGNPLQMDFLSGNDLDFDKLSDERTAVFLLLPDETDVWNTHASLLVMQVYQQLCMLSTHYPDKKLPHRFNFILEEFGNLYLGHDAAAIFSAGRSRNLRVTAVIQNFSQLEHRYGAAVADTIRYNCNNWIYLHSKDLATLRQLSELCGTYTLLHDGVTRPTASISQLQRIPQGQALILQGRKAPYLTDLAPIWSYPETAPSEAAVYPKRRSST